MAHTADSEPKVLSECMLPLTGVRVVNRIITDLGVMGVVDDGIALVEKTPSVAFEEIQTVRSYPLIVQCELYHG